jgi:hypothetical protein
MVQSPSMRGRTRYGQGSTWERYNDSGGPSAIQHGQESLRGLARRYGINQKTVAKWRKRPPRFRPRQLRHSLQLRPPPEDLTWPRAL